MVRFKSWDDYKQFMLKYATCSCFNCIGYHEDNEEFKGRFICWKTVSPINMIFLNVCAEWENHDGKQLKDYEDYPRINLNDEIVEKIESVNGLLSFDDIEVLINECKEIKKY